MARQQTGGQSRGQTRGGNTSASAGRGGTGRTTGAGSTSSAAEQRRGAPTGGQNAQRGTQGGTSEATNKQQAGEQRPDQERQLELSREAGNTATSGPISGTGTQTRGTRQQTGGLTARGQGQSSLLPALMANPWLMTNAFLSNPFGFSQAINQEMDRLFSSGDISPFGQTGAGAGQTGRGLATTSGQGARGLGQWAPQIEVRQRGNELTVSADLPGMKPEDVNIEIEDGLLTISGERQQSSEDRDEGFYRSERSYGSFVRSVALPDGVDESQVRANFDHGVLEITVPIPQQRQRSRKIQIEAGRGQSSAGTERQPSAGTQRQSPAGAERQR